LATGFDEPEPAEAILPEEREPLRTYYQSERRSECDIISPPLFDLEHYLTDAVERVREPDTGIRGILLRGSSMKVHGSFMRFHSSLYRIVLRNVDDSRQPDRYLLILSDAEFGEKIADCIYGIYMNIPLNMIEKDGWLHRLLSRSAESNVQYHMLRAFQTAKAMPSTGAGPEVDDQWLEFLRSCECEDDNHILENCRVHSLIRIVDDTRRAIESVRLRQRTDSA
jgi:hypothetical protein